MKVYTSNIRYTGENRLDITRKNNHFKGHHFAPTWKMIHMYKAHKLAWPDYVEQYMDLINHRLRTNPETSKIVAELLSKGEVTFMCFCRNPDKCHRTVLADMFVTMYGATYGGEIKGHWERIKNHH